MNDIRKKYACYVLCLIMYAKKNLSSEAIDIHIYIDFDLDTVDIFQI